MKGALASNWVVESFEDVSGGFRLLGTSKGYTSFSRAFSDGDKVFYAAHTDDGHREAGWAVVQGSNLVDRTPTATLTPQNVYTEGSPSPLAFQGRGTIACTFNAVAFDTIWDHVFREDNPHNVTAPQVDLEPVLAPLGPDEQNVQDALEFLFSYFSENSEGDWHITHIDGNHVYIEIKHGPRDEFPPSPADLKLAELKINHDEGHLWTKLADGTVVKIGDKDLVTEAPLDGQLYGRKDGAWHRVSLATVSDDMPQDPQEGDLWVDTAHTLELYVYAGGAWISMTGAGGGGGALADNVVIDEIDGTLVNKLLGREIDEDGKGRWRQIFTSDVVTEGAQPMFRSKETGRFTKATDPAAIRDQQTANWFLYETMMDMGDVHVDVDPPDDPSEGDMWYDTVRLELFVYAEGAWLPCSPLGARVDAGEILQAEILSRVEAGEVKQTQIATAVDDKLGKSERNTVTENFRILGDRKTFISTNENELGLYNLRTPTSGPHATNKEYVDGEIDRKIAAIEFPESDVDKAYVDQQDDALDARITSGEQLQNQILVEVRENTNNISSMNVLSQQNYGRSVKNEQDIAALQSSNFATVDYVDDEIGKIATPSLTVAQHAINCQPPGVEFRYQSGSSGLNEKYFQLWESGSDKRMRISSKGYSIDWLDSGIIQDYSMSSGPYFSIYVMPSIASTNDRVKWRQRVHGRVSRIDWHENDILVYISSWYSNGSLSPGANYFITIGGIL